MTKPINYFYEVYAPKAKDEQKFVDKHIVAKHKDRNGNGDDVFNAKNIKTVKRDKEGHGYDQGTDEKVYEEVDGENVKPKVIKVGSGKTIQHSNHFSIHLNKEHLGKISNLEDGGRHNFPCDTGKNLHWAAHRTGDKVTFRAMGDVNMKTHANINDLKEDFEEAYNKDAVDKSIKSSRQKIGGKEAKMIHALLKGRDKKNTNEEVELDEISDSSRYNYTSGKDRSKYINKSISKIDDNLEKQREMIRKIRAEPIKHDLKVHDLSKMDHSSAYDETQRNNNIKDGHVIKIKGGTAIQMDAWPVMVSGKTKKFHHLEDGKTWDTVDGGKYKKSYELANSLKRNNVKEAIVDRALANFVPEINNQEQLSDEERLISLLDTTISENNIHTLLGLFETLSEDNRIKMLILAEDQDGINELLDFAISLKEINEDN